MQVNLTFIGLDLNYIRKNEKSFLLIDFINVTLWYKDFRFSKKVIFLVER